MFRGLVIMKASELRNQSMDELQGFYETSRRELFKLTNQRKSPEKLSTLHEVRIKRRNIARVLTIMHEKKLAESNS
jgi:large subunit ribosomal protein L29